VHDGGMSTLFKAFRKYTQCDECGRGDDVARRGVACGDGVCSGTMRTLSACRVCHEPSFGGRVHTGCARDLKGQREQALAQAGAAYVARSSGRAG
jgi:hypothetical protein